jgi:YVTN family beta-propeller protein
MSRTVASLSAPLSATVGTVLALLASAVASPDAAAQASVVSSAPAPLVYVANSGSASLSLVDSATLAVVAVVPVGANPQDIAFAPDGARAYVVNMGSDTISVLDTATRTVVATVAVADAPRSAVVTPDGEHLYVGCRNGLVDVVALDTLAVLTTVTVGGPYADSVNGLCVSPDGSRVHALWGNLVSIDTATNTVVSSLYVGNTPTDMALSPDGDHAYVPCAFGYGPFVFAGSLATVSLRGGTVENVLNLWSIPSTISVSPDGTQAHVAYESTWANTGYAAGFLPSPWVERVDLVNHALIGGFSAGSSAGQSTYDTFGTAVFVAVPKSNHVRVVDPLTKALIATVPVGASPRALAFEPAHVAPALQKRPMPLTRRR